VSEGDERRGSFSVYGCSPGCVILSLVASVVLTVLVNGLMATFAPHGLRATRGS
jgi:hypothetical protein